MVMAEAAAPPEGTAPRKFACLDGYRALAALAVVLYHVMGRFSIHTSQATLGLYSSRLGNYGVTVFFLLSGFLLYRPFALAHLRGTPGPDVRRFYTRRLLRIIPAYWVALSALLFVFQYRNVGGPGDYATYYGFAQVYRGGGYAIGGLGQAWSLCVEMSFYAFVPLFALLARHLWWGTAPATRSRRLRSELYLVGGMYAFGIVFRWWALHHKDTIPTATTWLPALTDLFALGMLLAVASAWVEVGGRLPAAVDALVSRPWLCWLFAAQAYWALAMVHLPRAWEPETMGQSMDKPFVTGLTACFLLLPGTLGPERTTGIAGFLRSRPLVGLGMISYGIYLWHTEWIELYLNMRDSGQIANGFWMMLGFVLLLTVASATVSYYVIERPFLKLGNRRRPAAGHAARPPGGAKPPVDRPARQPVDA